MTRRAPVGDRGIQDSSAQTTKTTPDARQGETSGRIRWVLAIGLLLAIVAMVAIFIFH